MNIIGIDYKKMVLEIALQWLFMWTMYVFLKIFYALNRVMIS